MVNKRATIGLIRFRRQYLYYDAEDDEFIQALYDSKVDVLTRKLHLTALATE